MISLNRDLALVLCALLFLLAVSSRQCGAAEQEKEAESIPLMPRSDAVALSKFKDLVRPKTALRSWQLTKTTKNACGWIGVNCNLQKRVIGLSLPFFNLTGDISAAKSLASLSSLAFLNLDNNSFHGSLPPSWSSLTKLQLLTMDNNRLSGRVPASYAKLASLQDFSASWSSLAGPLPAFLFTLPHIISVDLTGNSFTGKLPMKYNPRLSVLNVGVNYLVGMVPSTVGSLRHLVLLDLHANLFHGNLPSFSDLSKLKQLSLGFNSFTGGFPDLGKCTVLVFAEISHNKFSGRLPLKFSKYPPNVQTLSLGYNSFSGTIPAAFGLFPQLAILDMSEANFQGTLPKFSSSLESLSLSKNKLSGRISSSLTTLPNLFQALLDENKFTGSLPSAVNCKYGMESGLGNFWVQNNLLSGPIPTSYAKCKFSNVDFSGNKLTGNLRVFDNTSYLFSFRAAGNEFVGRLPAFSGSLKTLNTLDLSRNMLAGGFPASYSKFNALSSFSVSYNMLKGKIPPQLAKFGRKSFVGNPKLCGAPLKACK